MVILVSKRFLRVTTGHFAQAITLWPFVILKSSKLKEDINLINHERIHLRQQIELLLVPFYLWYVTEFMIRWIIQKDSNKAYHSISFEKEAYLHERDRKYLKTRKFFSFIKYL